MIIFCLEVLFIAIRTEAYTVLGPAVPLVVQTGRSVTLPCSADTPLPTLDLEVQWIREDTGSIVHMFQEGESRPESQSPSYRGRAEFCSEEISKGNFSLLLMNVTSKDKGLYKCVVLSDQESRETTLRIDVEHLTVTGAVGPVSAYEGEDVILNCTVDTHVPVRQLQVQWMKIDGEILVLLFDEGENRPESQDGRFRGRAEFFSEEILKGNFSMKLRDIKTEDRGEFMCRVDTGSESVNATAWLQEQGFSTLNLCVLGLTFAAAVIAVLSCIPAVLCIKRGRNKKESKAEEVESRKRGTHDAEEEELSTKEGANGKRKRAELLYCLQVSVPCILLSIAFIIWGVIESKYFEKFTERALHFEIFFLTTGINSVLLQNMILRGAGADTKLLTGIFFGFVLLYGIMGIWRSKFFTGYSWFGRQGVLGYEIFLLIFTRSSVGFGIVFMVWFIIPEVRGTLLLFQGLSLQRKRLWEKFFGVLKFIFECASYILLLHFISDQDKEQPGIVCFMAFLYIMKAIMHFDHRSDLPVVPHILVYVFGSAGLSVLNSVALATEVFLKAEKGQRTMEDLRFVILLIESLFLACWLCLQIYAFCEKKIGLIKELKDLLQCCKKQEQRQTSDQHNQSSDGEDEFLFGRDEYIKMMVETVLPRLLAKVLPGLLAKMQTPAVEQESVSPPAQKTTQNHEAPDGAEKMEHLSLSEPTTEHSQEMPQDAIEMEPLRSSAKSERIFYESVQKGSFLHSSRCHNVSNEPDETELILSSFT